MIPRRLLVGVGGGIAAYKVAALVSQVAQAGHEVRVAMTAAATEFVGPATFAALSGKPVATGTFASDRWPLGAHIELSRDADLFLIAPATANLIARCANGFADDLLSTLYLQCECSVVMAPAMSTAMWCKPAVQRNIARLNEDAVQIIGPEEGWLSCRQRGAGRMADPETIWRAVRDALEPVA